jgi:hypothetical protein
MLLYSLEVSVPHDMCQQYHEVDASSISTLFRHTPLLRFSRHVEHCEQQLSANKEDPSAMWLCHLVCLRRIIEEASIVFELEDPASNVALHDAKSQFQLTLLTRQLKTWRDTTPKDINDGKAAPSRLSLMLTICRSS